jgi:hypothetical protein
VTFATACGNDLPPVPSPTRPILIEGMLAMLVKIWVQIVKTVQSV